MELWVTVVVAVIVALSTLGATLLQNRFSSKRFEKELERQREIDSHQWRRKVKSEPLIQLRKELTIMAYKYRNSIRNIHKCSPKFDDRRPTPEQIVILKEMDDYAVSEKFLQAVYVQHDTDLITAVEQLRDSFIELSESASLYDRLPAEERDEHEELFEKIEKQIPEVQELINKRLEEL
jgi:hypothetical protein